MRILVAGASGLVGSALVPFLRERGHGVRCLVRRIALDADEVRWDPAAGMLPEAALAGCEAVINLAGASIGAGVWTEPRRELILRSRVEATQTLVRAMAAQGTKPCVFISASAVGFYGDRGEEELTEAAAMGHGFLPEVCLAWETHAGNAARAGIRTVCLRLGAVLARQGGLVARLRPLFRAGLGGRLGDGRQWMSWIALGDLLGVVEHALTDTTLSGPVNVVAPIPVRNAEFTATLARGLRRPAFLPAPAWALRALFGRLADELLLSSTRAMPARLQEVGYVFRHAQLEEALR